MRIKIIFYVTGQKIGTKKSCQGTEQVREAARRKIKPFLLENDPEKILEQSHIGTSETKPRTKLVLVSREPLLYLEFNKPNKQNVSDLIYLKNSTFPSAKVTGNTRIGVRNETSKHHFLHVKSDKINT